MEKAAIFKAIFLVLAVLFFLGFISLQVFAAEEDMQYRDTSSLTGGIAGGGHPSGSGGPTNELDFSGDEIPSEDWDSFLNDISAIRRNSDLLICFVIPCFCAVLAVYKFCMWFYSTFIESAVRRISGKGGFEMFEKLKTKLFLVPALGGAMTLGSSLVAFAAQTGGGDASELPTISITTDMLTPLVEGVVSNIQVVLPVGLGLMGLMLGIKVIPRLISRFL